MAVETKETVRTTIDLPVDLHEKLCAEAGREKRSRHSQMVYALEKFFENEAASAAADKKERAK
jgi:predicted transcriptional regulator